MKRKLVGVFFLLTISFVLFSHPVFACVDAVCGNTITCPSGFETSRGGCKTCRCTPSPKVIKTWTFNVTIDCPAGQVLTQKVRFFSASFLEGQNLPNDFYWDYQPYSYDLNRSLNLTNYTPNDSMYIGLESDVMVSKSIGGGKYEQDPVELIPTGTPQNSIINYGKWFNPQTSMAKFSRDSLLAGSYAIAFSIPDTYKTQWCAVPTPTPTPPSTTVPNCTNLTGPDTITLGQSGTFSADFTSPQGELVGGVSIGKSGKFVWNPPGMGQYFGATANSGTASFTWAPAAAGTYDVFCRAWNDSVAECRGLASYVDGPPRYPCAGPNSSRTVTVVAPAGCQCNADSTCAAACTFYTFADVTYTTPLKCSLDTSLFPAAPSAANKTSWCQTIQRTRGDADGNGIVNTTDYFYYVAAVNGGKIPTTVNPDFNGDGEVGFTDRLIITESLRGTLTWP